MDEERGWISALVECDVCTHHWIAAFYHKCKRLECPNCSLNEELRNFTILRQYDSTDMDSKEIGEDD